MFNAFNQFSEFALKRILGDRHGKPAITKTRLSSQIFWFASSFSVPVHQMKRDSGVPPKNGQTVKLKIEIEKF